MAVANIAPYGIFTGLGTLGEPVPGGLLFVYLAGTTTKTTTYTSAGEGTANPNPVVMNAAGQAQVWLDPSNNVKFVFSPATDTDPPTNPFWTTDNISPAMTVTSAEELAPGATITLAGSVLGTTPVFTGAANITANVTIANTTVTPGAYTNASLTVEADGRLTSVGNGTTSGVTVAEFTYSVASGTAPDLVAATASSWHKRSLNTTVSNGIAGASLSGNSTIMPTGTYIVTYEAGLAVPVAGTIASAASRLQNTTGNTTVLITPTATSAAASEAIMNAATGVVTVSGNTTFEIDTWPNASMSGGLALSTGSNEVYVRIVWMKIA